MAGQTPAKSSRSRQRKVDEQAETGGDTAPSTQRKIESWFRSKSAPDMTSNDSARPPLSQGSPIPTPLRSTMAQGTSTNNEDATLQLQRANSAPLASSHPLVDVSSLRLRGTSRMEVRNRRNIPDYQQANAPQQEDQVTSESSAKRSKTTAEGDTEMVVIQDSDEEVSVSVDTKKEQEPEKPTRQILRISAGRAAAAAGIHCYADIGEMFLEFLYQDLPELLLEDAVLAGVEIVSPELERARLLTKSGEADAVDLILKEAAKAPAIEGAQAAKEAVGQAIAAAEKTKKLTAEEAQELKNTLELEINLEFGARHEDAAIEAYEQRVGRKVYGQQHRVSVRMPSEGPDVALAKAFPAPFPALRPRDDLQLKMEGNKEAPLDGSLKRKRDHHEEPYFRLTGFVDGLVDIVRGTPGPPNPTMPGRGQQSRQAQTMPAVPVDAADSETLVVEVKHRMGRIKDPPNIYDVVQLCSYCRALGCTRGDLVQCLRTGPTSNEKVPIRPEMLHVTRIDFSEGSPDRHGWDKHVLPGLYAIAAAVYAAREDRPLRLRLLAATTPEERTKIVGEMCPHLGR